MPRRPEVDYAPIRKYYLVNPTVSNRAIADKFKVSYNALRIQISRHGWKQERDEYYGDIAADYIEASKNREIIEREELDERLKVNNRLALDQVEAHLSAMGVGTDADGKPTMIREGVPIKDLRALVDIQRMVQESEYRRLNVPMPKQPIEVAAAIPSPADALPLPDIDLDIDAKIKTARYAELTALPALDDSGNGKGNGQDGDTDGSGQ